MIVDFHCHSTASDGTCSPHEMAERGKTFAAMALTDHDNVDGAAEFMGAKDGAQLRVPGVELSIEPGDGFDMFHLLALGVDPANEEFLRLLDRILEGRNARNERILENFKKQGFEMSETIADYRHGDVLARPHFARWLVDHHAVNSISEAFERYLLPDSPAETRCYEKRWQADQEDTFRIVHAAGGLAVMAHPKYWKREWKTLGCDYGLAERGLAALREKGLDGVEALYEANTNEENVEFCRISNRLNYLKSAGSDFHGSNKPTITLGMNVSENFISPLLERLQ